MSRSKAIGTEFEHQMVELLVKHGYWAHFIVPDIRGAQPFDIIAARDGIPYAIECKTLNAKRSSISFTRIEENQRLACELWMSRGNPEPYIAVEHTGKVYIIPYLILKTQGTVKLTSAYLWEVLEDECEV